MAALAQMLADMVMKELPEEVRAAMTPEGIERIKQKCTLEYAYWRTSMDTILEQQTEILTRLEKMENDNDSGGRKPRPVGGTRARLSSSS